MMIIVLGANAFTLALMHALSQQGHSLTCVTRDDDYLERIQQRIDCRTIHGSPSYPNTLREAHADKADVLIAATVNDEMNMVACQVAFSLFHIPIKIACISSAHYLIRHDLFNNENLPIDVFINPEQVITDHLMHLIQMPGATAHIQLPHCSHICINTTLASSSTLAHQTVEDLMQAMPNDPPLLVAIHRNKQAVTLSPQTQLLPRDHLTLIGSQKTTEYCLQLCQNNPLPYQRLLIASSDATGQLLAQKLSADHQVKIIDHDSARCRKLAEALPHCIVLHGDLTDENLMQEENIDAIDLFCATTQDDEDNIMAAIQAKYLGARKSLLLIKHRSYARLLQHDEIDIALSPHQLVVDKIITHCQHPWIKTYHQIPPFGHLIGVALPTAIATMPTCKQCPCIGIIRNGNWLAPPKTLQKHDQLIYFTHDPDGLKCLQKTLAKVAIKYQP